MHTQVRLLLMDGNQAEASAVQSAVADAVTGVEVRRVATREDLVHALTEFRPHVVVTEFAAPDIDAFAAVDIVRSLSPAVPVVVISGEASQGDVVRLHERGVSGIVARDQLGRLGTAIRRALDDRQRQQRTAVPGCDADERFRTISHLAPIGIFEMDADQVYTYVNPRWSSITGIRAEEVLGQRLGSVIESAGLARFAESGRDSDERSARFEFRHRDGSHRIMMMTARAVRDPAGAVGGWVGTIADVTAESRAQAALAEARDRANEASEFKSRFLANMSHEIRTPMIGVIGMTDLLLETTLDPQQRDYVETLRSSGEALLDVINDILDLSKVEAGKLDIDEQDFDVERTVYDVVDLLAGNARAKGIEMIVHVDAAVPAVVRGDPGRIRQVLTNLVGNSVKFTDSGHVEIQVCFRDQSDGRSMLGFDVSDTGEGVTREQLNRIFEPFTQADRTTSRKHGGTGLGLAISNQLVNLMGGELWAVSEPGRGSTFSFTVQVTVDRDAKRPDWARKDVELAGLRALIVDDVETQRQVVGDYLELWGIQIETAADVPAALDLMRSSGPAAPFAVMVVDEALVEPGGSRLIEVAAASSTRVVTVGDPRPTGDGLGEGDAAAVGFVSKPVHRDDLRAVLHAVLGKSNASSRPQHDHPAPEPDRDTSVGYVLLAEDNLINQKVTVAMLSSAGYQVDTVRDGSAAVEAAVAHRYDAILMDCQMPGLSGYEATAAIRDQEGTKRHTPIIALTAAARQEDRERCLAEGMDDYIAKPVSKDHLLSALGDSIRS